MVSNGIKTLKSLQSESDSKVDIEYLFLHLPLKHLQTNNIYIKLNVHELTRAETMKVSGL